LPKILTAPGANYEQIVNFLLIFFKKIKKKLPHPRIKKWGMPFKEAGGREKKFPHPDKKIPHSREKRPPCGGALECCYMTLKGCLGTAFTACCYGCLL